MSHRLFIFVSETLRGDYLSLADETTDVLVIPEGQLTAEREPPEKDPLSELQPDPWESELKDTIAKRIRGYEQWQQSRIRVAGHLRTCFGPLANLDWQRDQRFREKEVGLQEELGHEIDIQIWGFHHKKEWSEIWSMVRQIKPYLNDPSNENKVQFFLALEEAFQRSTLAFESSPTRIKERSRWERFSVLKHEIIGSLGPLRIRLETARDIEAKEPDRANAIRLEVGKAIEIKLQQARKLLRKYSEGIPAGETQPLLAEVSELIEAKPNLDGFTSWLLQLDKSLDNLRSLRTNE